MPFKGTPEVVQAIFSGSVDCYWVPLSAGKSHVQSGKLRPLAVSTAKRNPVMPDVPTTGEAGVKGADAPLWFGLWGPAGVPAEIVKKINADVRRALADPETKKRLTNLGNDPMDMSAEEFARFVRSEIDDYERVVRGAGIPRQKASGGAGEALFARGGDIEQNDLIGSPVVEKAGGEVVIIPLTPGHSTTATIAKLRDARS